MTSDDLNYGKAVHTTRSHARGGGGIDPGRIAWAAFLLATIALGGCGGLVFAAVTNLQVHEYTFDETTVLRAKVPISLYIDPETKVRELFPPPRVLKRGDYPLGYAEGAYRDPVVEFPVGSEFQLVKVVENYEAWNGTYSMVFVAIGSGEYAGKLAYLPAGFGRFQDHQWTPTSSLFTRVGSGKSGFGILKKLWFADKTSVADVCGNE